MKTIKNSKENIIYKVMILAGLIFTPVLSACGNIEIFQKPPQTEVIYESSSRMQLDTYYVKNSTKFAPVYYPEGTATKIARSVREDRIFYFIGDQGMVPTHYKGEIVAYASKSASLDEVTLERFKDMGYSIGIYGGKYDPEDGYYHISLKNNLCNFCNAAEVLSGVISDEIRIVSVNGEPIGSILDKGSGIITGLTKGEKCQLEFYSGTYYYRQTMYADVQFLKAYEISTYNSKYISDTRNGYMCFETPQNLRSGYYFINGKGLFLYHDYTREERRDYEDLNVSSYMTAEEAIAAYSRQYAVNLKKNTKNVEIIVKCFTELDEEASGKVVAPDKTIYEMDVNRETNTISLTLSLAQAGEWNVYIPQYISVLSVDADGNFLEEDTVCYEKEFDIESDMTFKRFQIEVDGEGEVYGNLVREGDSRTYTFLENKYKYDDNGRSAYQRYLYLEMPYLEAGKYTVKIYYYQSDTTLKELEVTTYEDTDSDIFIID